MKTKLLITILFALALGQNIQAQTCSGTADLPLDVATKINAGTANEIEVTPSGSGVTSYSESFTSCNYTTSAGALWVGSSGAWTLTYNFSKKVNNLVIAITATGHPGDETFNFSSNGGAVNIAANACFTTVSGSQIVSGGGSTSATSGGGGYFTISTADGYSQLTISAPSGAYNGSLIGICQTSIIPAPNAVLTKSVSPSSIANGGTATYTFNVANTSSGNLSLSGLSFTDNLPSGLRVAATPNVVTSNLTGGSVTATAGGTSITATGYSIAAGATGTITVNVTNASGQLNASCGSNPVAFTNGSGRITSISNNLTNNIGTGPCLLVTLPPAGLTKSVSPSAIVSGGTATYTFAIANTASGNGALTGVNFTDNLPSGLRVAATPNVVTSNLTAGSVTATAGGTSITATGYSIAAGATGTITVNVTNASGQLNASCASNPAAFTNGSGNISSISNNLTNNIGTGPCLVVTPVPAGLSKSVSPSSITSGGTATYTFTIANTASGNSALTGVNFTDNLPSGLRIAATPNVVSSNLTAGSVTATAGGTSITATGYSIAAGATGTITVNVTNASGQLNASCGSNPAAFTNGSGNISSISSNLNNNIGTGPCLVVTPVPAGLSKSVSPSSIVSGGTATYTFTIVNTAAGNIALTGVNFTDNLPSGLRIAATPNVVTSNLTAGSVIATAGGTSITATGYSIAAGATGTITVNVTNASGQLNASCGSNPAAFTNGAANISGLSSNLANNVGIGACLVVIACNAGNTAPVIN